MKKYTNVSLNEVLDILGLFHSETATLIAYAMKKADNFGFDSFQNDNKVISAEEFFSHANSIIDANDTSTCSMADIAMKRTGFVYLSGSCKTYSFNMTSYENGVANFTVTIPADSSIMNEIEAILG